MENKKIILNDCIMPTDRGGNPVEVQFNHTERVDRRIISGHIRPTPLVILEVVISKSLKFRIYRDKNNASNLEFRFLNLDVLAVLYEEERNQFIQLYTDFTREYLDKTGVMEYINGMMLKPITEGMIMGMNDQCTYLIKKYESSIGRTLVEIFIDDYYRKINPKENK